MKRFIGALLVGTFVFAGVLASAAALPVTGGTVQVGTDVTLACDPDGVTVSWQVDQNGVATSATISGVNDVTCAGQELYIFPLNAVGQVMGFGHSPSVDCGAPGTPLTYVPALITSGTTSYKVALATSAPDLSGPNVCGLNASLIEGVRVMIGI